MSIILSLPTKRPLSVQKPQISRPWKSSCSVWSRSGWWPKRSSLSVGSQMRLWTIHLFQGLGPGSRENPDFHGPMWMGGALGEKNLCILGGEFFQRFFFWNFSPLDPGDDLIWLYNMFQMGWFNHQLVLLMFQHGSTKGSTSLKFTRLRQRVACHIWWNWL